MLTFGSLFAGIGGFDLAFERAAMQCVTQVENDERCRTVLAHHWPNVDRSVEDVRDFGKRTWQGRAIDVICGGFPCQDVSVAGQRAGLAGERSGLWFEFLRILGELEPRWVVIENVPGLLSSNEGRDFATILRGLVECGYGVCWRILDAQYAGVPQRRRRVFIVGSLGDGRAAEVLFERTSSAWDSPPSRETGQRVARAIARGSVSSGYRYDVNGEDFVYQCHGGDVGRMGALRKGRGDVQSGVPFVARPLAFSQTVDHYDESQQTYVVRPLESHPGRYDANQPYVTAFAWQQGVSPNDRSYPVRAGDYTGSLSSTRCDAVAGQFGVRRLTPRECERLQGFPDDWTLVDGMSDSARYRMLGNAVAVPVVEWIGRRIVEVESHPTQG